MGSRGWRVVVVLLVVLNVGLVAWIVTRTSSDTASVSYVRAPSERGPLLAREQTVVDLFQRVSPSVVFITTAVDVRRGFGLKVHRVPQGHGSGFVWDHDGHIVTNYHVIAEASAATVTLADGSEWNARRVGVAPDHDLAVLKIDSPKERLTPIVVGRSEDLKVGQFAMAIGNPFGLDQSLTTGVISALDREIDATNKRTIYGVIQTDVAVNPGNSGGPLIDSAGLVVGVNTAIHSTTGASAGISFAVPVDTVRRIVPKLIRDGEAPRPGLGLKVVPPRRARALGVSEGAAVYVVNKDSAAERAGIMGLHRDRRGRVRVGDVIVAFEGKPIREIDDLNRALDGRSVGDVVELTVRRNGRDEPITVNLQAIR